MVRRRGSLPNLLRSGHLVPGIAFVSLQTMSPPPPPSLAELLEHLHLESSQPPDERFGWLHRRSQHMQHPLVQFDFSQTHCTLRIVPKRKRRKGPAPDRKHKAVTQEKTATSGSSGSSSDESEQKDPVFMKLKWSEVLGTHLQTACGQPLCRRSVVPRTVYMLALYACPSDGLLPDGSQQQQHHLHLHKDDLPTKRKLRKWTFRFFGDEIERVTQLHHALNRYADPRRDQLEDIRRQSLLQPEEAISGPLRRFRVLIDPDAGSGWGLSKYEQLAAPMFRVANIETSVEIITDIDRVRELAKQLPLDRFECVAIAGGDNYMHECTFLRPSIDVCCSLTDISLGFCVQSCRD
jgi:hypothetical protein